MAKLTVAQLTELVENLTERVTQLEQAKTAPVTRHIPNITCGACKQTHHSSTEVKACYTSKAKTA